MNDNEFVSLEELFQDITADSSETEKIETDSQELYDNPKPSNSETARMEIFDWLQCIVWAIVAGVFIFVFFGRTIGVEGSSMLDTLHHTDRVIISNLFYTPENGDIIILKTTKDNRNGVPLVKRVIATAGQVIDINFDNGEVSVAKDANSVPEVLYEPYIKEPTYARIDFRGPMEIPEGYVFVMGDNRNHSSDSRSSNVGLVDTRMILGRVLFLFFPGLETDGSRDWSRIGVVE